MDCYKLKTQNSKLKTKTKNLKLIILTVFFVFTYFLYKNISESVFIKNKDRINVVFYGKNTVFYSLGLKDISYFFSIPTDVEIEMPGGYGYYRIGAIGKLVSLEKDNDILRKVFSSASSSFIDLYFFPQGESIFYGQEKQNQSVFPLKKIFINKSNANLFDRFFLLFFFLRNPVNQFKEITDLPLEIEDKRAIFDRNEFFKEYQGFFYKKTYRNIGDNVQILYTKSYKTAVLISDILEGEGIKVVDISEKSKIKDQGSDKCTVIQNSKKPLVIAKGIQDFFGCDFKRGETDISDIIIILNSLEKSWEVN